MQHVVDLVFYDKIAIPVLWVLWKDLCCLLQSFYLFIYLFIYSFIHSDLYYNSVGTMQSGFGLLLSPPWLEVTFHVRLPSLPSVWCVRSSACFKMVLLSPSLPWNCVRAESGLESPISCPHHPRAGHRCMPHAWLPESWISWFTGSMPSFLFCWHSPGRLCWLVLLQHDIS